MQVFIFPPLHTFSFLPTPSLLYHCLTVLSHFFAYVCSFLHILCSNFSFHPVYPPFVVQFHVLLYVNIVTVLQLWSVLLLSAILFHALHISCKDPSFFNFEFLNMFHGKCNTQSRINVLKNCISMSFWHVWHCAFAKCSLLTWSKSGPCPILKLLFQYCENYSWYSRTLHHIYLQYHGDWNRNSNQNFSLHVQFIGYVIQGDDTPFLVT